MWVFFFSNFQFFPESFFHIIVCFSFIADFLTHFSHSSFCVAEFLLQAQNCFICLFLSSFKSLIMFSRKCLNSSSAILPVSVSWSSEVRSHDLWRAAWHLRVSCFPLSCLVYLFAWVCLLSWWIILELADYALKLSLQKLRKEKANCCGSISIKPFWKLLPSTTPPPGVPSSLLCPICLFDCSLFSSIL